MNNDEQVTVTQADEDAARMLVSWIDGPARPILFKAAKLAFARHRLATQSPSSDIEAEAKRQFNAGYLIAVSNLVNLHGADTEAADVLDQLGATEGILRQMDFGDYDAKPLRRLFRDISRRRKYDRQRAALKETPNVG